MKNALLLTFLLFTVVQLPIAQVSFQTHLGFSPAISPSNADIMLNKSNPIDQFFFNMAEINSQIFIGVTIQMELSNAIYMSMNTIYTQRQYVYSCSYLVSSVFHPVQDMSMWEKEKYLQFPLNMGVHLGPIAVESGFTVLASLHKKSDLYQMNGYAEIPSRLKLGWQSEMKVKIADFAFGLEYLGYLYRVGEGASLHGQSLEVRHVPGQFVFNFYYAL